MNHEIRCGNAYPLGATWEIDGVNFAIFSEHATKVVLCLYEGEKVTEIELPSKSSHIHHGFVTGLKPGQLYGYRIYGPYEPENGHRFNHNKLLLDPYAKAVFGPIKWNDTCYGYNREEDDLSFNHADSAPFVPRSVVVDTRFDWGGDQPLNRRYDEMVVYEMNVKGFSQSLQGIPEALRGKYAALAHPVAIEHLTGLGVTAVELMPVQFFVSDAELDEKGLSNYWGYNTLGFFAPHPKYSSNGSLCGELTEFKEMVRVLHGHGIEVILDVVYNHTGEGSNLGPTLCFRGIDNQNYYRLEKENPRAYKDYTGTGNTLDTQQPWILQLIMDSLRYWITEMHVDGFRFDLAPALARNLAEVDQLSAFFSIIYQDPIISRAKLIAEPWDVGDGGYQVGRFPINWAEWNGKFRNDIRDYWNGQQIDLRTFLMRLLGSPDLYKNNGRTPSASINFITAHDGYTLHDLVTYKDKHNEKNGDGNTDGTDENKSSNWGTEGETADEKINRSRKLHQKNLLATLLISQGVPMLLAGDEIGNSKGGNNNTYSQDNETSWISWDKADDIQLDFTRKLGNLRKVHPVLRQRKWAFVDDAIHSQEADIELFMANGEKIPFGKEMGHCPNTFCLLLENKQNKQAEKEKSNGFGTMLYIVFNRSDTRLECPLPKRNGNITWQKIIDSDKEIQRETEIDDDNRPISVGPFSIVILDGTQLQKTG